MMRGNGDGRYQGGLTLMEMLVTLVIVAMISGILWQALQQLARVERNLETSGQEELNVALHQEWLRQALESLVPMMGEGAFEGDELALQGWAMDLPGLPDGQLGQFELRIERNGAAADGHRLVLIMGRESIVEVRHRLTLLEWSGRQGGFSYIGADGGRQSQWRAADLKPGASRLPAAIIVRTGHERFALLVATVRTSGSALPSRTEFEKL